MVDRHENTEAFREAVPKRYRQRHVNTEALREAVPRRYGRRHVNTEALREAVPRRYRGGTGAGPHPIGKTCTLRKAGQPPRLAD